MTMLQAVKACLRKYVVFSGRASRAEFWKFVLAIFLASILASIANALVFGPLEETTFVVRTSQNGTTQGLTNETVYGPGPISTLLGFAVLLPFLAAVSRRLHDIGRPGWHLFLPWGISILLTMVTLFAFRVDVPVDDAIKTAFPSIGDTLAVPQPPLQLFLSSWLISFATLILSIVWLARRARPGSNRYGPNPLELTRGSSEAPMVITSR